MPNSHRIRKQVYLLTEEELNQHPLWEFCAGEEGEEDQDEATVKPSEHKEVPGYSPGMFTLTSDVTFADGTSAIGYIYSGGPEDGMGCTQPNVITSSGQVNFWLGSLKFVKDPQKQIEKRLEMLSKTSAAIFPMLFRTRPHINGSNMEIVIDSFMGGGGKMSPVAVR